MIKLKLNNHIGMSEEKNLQSKDRRSPFFKWNFVLLAVIILLLVANIYFITKYFILKVESANKEFEKMFEQTGLREGGVLWQNTIRWSFSSSILQTIYEHQKGADNTMDDLKEALQQHDDDGIAIYFYDYTTNDLTSTERPGLDNFHVWSSALCGPGMTKTHILNKEKDGNYSENLLQLSATRDFAIVYGVKRLQKDRCHKMS